MRKKLRYHKKKTVGRQLAMPEGLPGIRGMASWHVRESLPGETPHTINYLGGAARMAVPDDGVVDDKMVMIHEMLHAAHSPVEPPRALPRINGQDGLIHIEPIMIAEELRINTMMRFNMGYEWTYAHTNWDRLEEVVRYVAKHPNSDSIKTLITQMICSWPLEGYYMVDLESRVRHILINMVMDNSLDPKLRDYLQLINQFLANMLLHLWNKWLDDFQAVYQAGSIPSWKQFTIPIADYLHDIWDSLDRIHATAAEGAQAAADAAASPDADLKQLNMQQGSTASQDLHQLASNPTGERKPVKFDPQRGAPKWGDIDFVEPPRTVKLPGKNRQKSKYHATDMGVVPRNLHRAIIDGQVFATKRQEPGGSVLIDDSGSMSWLPSEIMDIMIAAPAVVIGAYSGRRERGELRVVAKNGKRVPNNQLETPYGGNDIDLPAILWLAEQPEPRIWVTDSGVNPGKGGDPIAAKQQCYDACIEHNINIVKTAKQAHEVFTGARKLYR